MSLGQRLQKAPEKGNAAEQTSQDYEATIRRLKLLSKSQTALLKVNCTIVRSSFNNWLIFISLIF
jgi:hypothetical protein